MNQDAPFFYPDQTRGSACHYCQRNIWPIPSPWGSLWVTAYGTEWETARHTPETHSCTNAPKRLHSPIEDEPIYRQDR